MTTLKERVKAAILAEPHKANMDAWAVANNLSNFVAPGPLPCDTTLCIAGHIAHAAGAAVFSAGFANTGDGHMHKIRDFAAEAAGLTDAESEKLFFANNWDFDLRDKYAAASSFDAAAAIMCEAIDRYWPDPVTYSTAQIAEACGVKPRTLFQYARRHELIPQKSGNLYRWPAKDAHELINQYTHLTWRYLDLRSDIYAAVDRLREGKEQIVSRRLAGEVISQADVDAYLEPLRYELAKLEERRNNLADTFIKGLEKWRT